MQQQHCSFCVLRSSEHYWILPSVLELAPYRLLIRAITTAALTSTILETYLRAKLPDRSQLPPPARYITRSRLHHSSTERGAIASRQLATSRSVCFCFPHQRLFLLRVVASIRVDCSQPSAGSLPTGAATIPRGSTWTPALPSKPQLLDSHKANNWGLIPRGNCRTSTSPWFDFELRFAHNSSTLLSPSKGFPPSGSAYSTLRLLRRKKERRTTRRHDGLWRLQYHLLGPTSTRRIGTQRFTIRNPHQRRQP